MDSSDPMTWVAVVGFIALIVLVPIAIFLGISFAVIRLPVRLIEVIRDGSDDGRMTPAAVVATVFLAVLAFFLGLKAIEFALVVIR